MIQKRSWKPFSRKVGKTAKIKGFRPGHVPKPVLEAYYKDYAEEEAINNLVNRFYWNAIEEHKITPLTQPQIDPQGIVQESPFFFFCKPSRWSRCWTRNSIRGCNWKKRNGT